MKTEEKILDYMDGTLSENESGELLHSLSVSPEKRVVLEQHIKLRELTGLAQKPFAVPQELEARMAERFAAIAEYNHELAGGAMIVEQAARPSIISRMTAALAGFMAQYPVRTGFAVAAASVIAYFAFSAGNSSVDGSRSSVVDDRSSIVGGQAVPNNQVSTADKGMSSSTTINNGVTAASPSKAAPQGNNFSHQSNDNHTSHVNSGTSPKANIPSSRERMASQHPVQNVHGLKQPRNNANVAHNDRIPVNSVTPPEKTPAALDKNVADVPNAVVTPQDKDEKTNENARVNTDNANPAKDIAVATPAKDAHSPNVSLAENNVHGSSSEQNPFKQRNDISSGFPLALRLYGSIGGSFVNVHDNDKTLASRTEEAALIGIDYIASSHWAFGVEGGNAAISQLITQSALQSGTSGLPSISRVVVNNVVTSGSQFYARAVAHYTFNPEDAFHFEGTAGIGAAFAGKAAPLISGALYLVHDFSQNWGLSGGFAFAGAWTSSNSQSAASQAVATGADPIGYVTTNHALSTLFTPSYALRVGVKFRPSW